MTSEAFFSSLRGVLQSTPERWQSLAQAFPEEALRRRPAMGEWSALECLLHLIDLDRGVFPQRVRAILAGQNFPAFSPDAEAAPWLNRPQRRIWRLNLRRCGAIIWRCWRASRRRIWRARPCMPNWGR